MLTVAYPGAVTDSSSHESGLAGSTLVAPESPTVSRGVHPDTVAS